VSARATRAERAPRSAATSRSAADLGSDPPRARLAWRFAVVCLAVLVCTGMRSAQDIAETDGPHVRTAQFLAALMAWRKGEAESPAALDAAAREMATHDGRDDVLQIAAHYRTLDAEARAEGLALEARYEELRARWVEWDELAELGLEPPFEALAVPLSLELEALLEAARHALDVAPLARTEALLARLILWEAELEAEADAAEFVADPARLTRAEELARQSARRFERAGFVMPRLEPLWLIGRLARARGAALEAREALHAAARLARSVHRDDWRERALLVLLALELDAGNLLGARSLVEELATFRDPRTCWALAREHAASLLHADRAEEARTFLANHPPRTVAPAQSDAAGRAFDDLPRTADEEWRALRVSAALRAGEIDEARELVTSLSGTGEYSLLARASLALYEEDAAEVRALLVPALTAEGWSPKSRTMARVLTAEAHALEGRHAEATALLHDALEAARGWESERASRAGSVLGEWVGLHAVALLTRAQLESGQSQRALLTALGWQARSLRREHHEPTLADVLVEASGATLGLVTWVIGPDFTVALHVDPSGVVSGEVVPLGRSDVERGVVRLRQAILARDTRGAESLGAELARALLPRRLFEALRLRTRDAPQIAAGPRDSAGTRDTGFGADTVVIVAHGPLERAPFTALSVEGVPLLELAGLRILPGFLPPCVTPGIGWGLGAGRDEGARAARSAWVLAGDPCDAAGRSRLAGAARELEELARFLTLERTLVGAHLTREELLLALAGRAPLHIATHLVPSPTALDDTRFGAPPVALECSHGTCVTAREIEARAPRLPLVVLGACASADGELLDGEGTLGLARTFLAAGTRGAVVTTWPIEDGAAREFSLALHAALASGLPPSRATASAARALRAAGWPASEWAAYRFAGRD
jgi:hypothetical protein